MLNLIFLVYKKSLAKQDFLQLLTGLGPVGATFKKALYIALFRQTLGIKPFLALFFIFKKKYFSCFSDVFLRCITRYITRKNFLKTF